MSLDAWPKLPDDVVQQLAQNRIYHSREDRSGGIHAYIQGGSGLRYVTEGGVVEDVHDPAFRHSDHTPSFRNGETLPENAIFALSAHDTVHHLGIRAMAPPRRWWQFWKPKVPPEKWVQEPHDYTVREMVGPGGTDSLASVLEFVIPSGPIEGSRTPGLHLESIVPRESLMELFSTLGQNPAMALSYIARVASYGANEFREVGWANPPKSHAEHMQGLLERAALGGTAMLWVSPDGSTQKVEIPKLKS